MRPGVLITGGGRGIGAATARRFAQEGWNVVINYRRAQQRAEEVVEELRKARVEAWALQGDLSQEQEARELVAQAEKLLGEISALVCNAGVAEHQMVLTDVTYDMWKNLMGTNLDGVFYTIREATKGMVRRQGGTIVTLSSMWGVTGGSCEVAYSASKAGIIGLTKALAKELGPSHIRVNCVAPGVIQTEMNHELSQEDFLSLAQETPLGRIGSPEEVAEAILFLSTPASSFITGQVLQVNGGLVI